MSADDSQDSLDKIEEAKKLYERYLEISQIAVVPLVDEGLTEEWRPVPSDGLAPENSGGSGQVSTSPLTLRWT